MYYSILVMMLLALAACSSAPKSDAPAEPFPEKATGDTFDLTPDRLAKLMPYVFEAIHWGYSALAHTDDQLTARALTPDGRRVEIRADQIADESVKVSVYVQYFGDDALQRQFLQTIAQQQQRFAGKEIR